MMSEEDRQRAVLFNDITHAPREAGEMLFSERQALQDHLWKQGWRREVRDEDVTERPKVITDAKIRSLNLVDEGPNPAHGVYPLEVGKP